MGKMESPIRPAATKAWEATTQARTPILSAIFGAQISTNSCVTKLNRTSSEILSNEIENCVLNVTNNSGTKLFTIACVVEPPKQA